MWDVTKLSADYLLPIPESVRTACGWEVGQKFIFVTTKDGMLLLPAPIQEETAGSMTEAECGPDEEA